MRFAISGIARKGGRKKAKEVCAFVRECKSGFERFTPYVRELRKKQSVTSQSLEKLEDAVYAIFVRSSEYNLPPEMLDDIVAQSISNYNASYHDMNTSHARGRGDYDSDDDSSHHDV